MTDREELLAEIDGVLAELRESASNGVPVLVEGEKDIRALGRLGIVGNFRKITGRGSVLGSVEKLKGFEEVILLPDFDREGKALATFCVKHLRRVGAKPNLDFWKKIGGLVRRDVKDVEGLASFVLKQRAALNIQQRSSPRTF